MVSEPTQADVIFEFRYVIEQSAGTSTESFTITNAKTNELLYEDGRVYSPPTGGLPGVVGAIRYKHYSMAQDMVKELRARIEVSRVRPHV